MRISTKGRYGLRVMLELTLRHGNGPVMMSALAASQNISRKYLHSLLTSLKAVGLVRSVRGAGGGYVLAHEPADIKVSQVVQALEGSLLPVECTKDSSICERSETCAAHDVWEELGRAMERVLSGITLADLAARQGAKLSQATMYYI
jgi:Rrf2 family protein